MALNEGWGRRLRDAKRAWEAAHDRDLTFGEIGTRVAEILGREKPYSHVAAGAWFEKGQEPASFDVAVALAQLLEVDPGVLTFGEKSERGPVRVPVMKNPPALTRAQAGKRKPGS